MTDNHAPFSVQVERLAHCRAQAAASIAWNRKLRAQMHDLEAQTASLHAENARLQDEVFRLRIILRNVDLFLRG